jgi:hypothetical protein
MTTSVCFRVSRYNEAMKCLWMRARRVQSLWEVGALKFNTCHAPAVLKKKGTEMVDFAN